MCAYFQHFSTLTVLVPDLPAVEDNNWPLRLSNKLIIPLPIEHDVQFQFLNTMPRHHIAERGQFIRRPSGCAGLT